MDRTTEYSIEDLLTNESFLNFYFKKNEDDVLDWEEWRDETESNAALVAQAFDLLDRLSLRWNADQIQGHWTALQAQIAPLRNAPKVVWFSWRWAASILAIVSVGIGWWCHKGQPEAMVLSNEHPDRLMIYKLPDGTKLQVKPHSKILLSNTFGQKSRDLHLEGEALFIVAPDTSRPFRVFTHDLAVTALGTTFNVRAVTGEPESKVVLTEGKVRVEAATTADVLNPGEEIVFKTKERRLATKRKIAAPAPKAEIKSALQAGSWVYFNQTPFVDVATSLEYNFNVRFIGIYPTLRDQPVSYRFRGDQPLHTILKDLSIRCHFTYKIRGNEILIEEERATFEGPGE